MERSAGTDGDVLGRLLAVAPSGTVAWVILGFEDERIARGLLPGRSSHWDDARVRGKLAGQPVLFAQASPRGPTWVGWGVVLDPPERWKVFGVDVDCRGVMRPPWAVQDGAADNVPSTDRFARHVWEYPEVGRALGLEASRPRTPYLDTGARDLRLSVHDLRLLTALQPRLLHLPGPEGERAPGAP